MIDASYRPIQSPSAYTVEIDGEAVILDEAGDRLHLLNTTATTVWRHLHGEANVGEICVVIADRFQAAPDLVLSDTIEVIRALAAQGLLGVASPDGEAS